MERERGLFFFSVAYLHSGRFLKRALVKNRKREGRERHGASNFCEGPKITGRRVPDVEICNFENRSPFVNAALPRVSL